MVKAIEAARYSPTDANTAALLACLSYRHALRVIWELRARPLRFRQLQEACGGISPSVLQSRIRELRQAGVLERVPGLGYRLTARGETLFAILAPLNQWASDRRASDA